MVISSRGVAEIFGVNLGTFSIMPVNTFQLLVMKCFKLLEYFDTVIEECRARLQLKEKFGFQSCVDDHVRLTSNEF